MTKKENFMAVSCGPHRMLLQNRDGSRETNLPKSTCCPVNGAKKEIWRAKISNSGRRKLIKNISYQ